MYKSFLQFINDISSEQLDLFMNIGTALGRFYNVFSLIFCVTLIYACSRMTANTIFHKDSKFWSQFLLKTIVAYTILASTVYSMKLYFKAPRPYIVYGEQYLRGHEVPDSAYSFPSGHTAFAALLVFLCWQISNKCVKMVLIFYFLWVAVSRIYLGMHFPSDILFSVLIAAVVYLLCERIKTVLFKTFGVRVLL